MKWSEISSSQRDVVIEKLKQKDETTSYPVTYKLINDVENEIDLRIGKQLKKIPYQFRLLRFRCYRILWLKQ